MPLRSWREHWGKAVRQADKLTVFSQSSAVIVETAWPDVKSKIICRPHKALAKVPALKPSHKQPGVIGILGAIGAVKGARIVSELAHYLASIPSAPRLIVIGEFDHSFALPPTVKVTGHYDPTYLPQLLSSNSVTAWLMPSIPAFPKWRVV